MDGISRSPFHLYLSRLSFFLNKAECDDRSLYYGIYVYTKASTLDIYADEGKPC